MPVTTDATNPRRLTATLTAAADQSQIWFLPTGYDRAALTVHAGAGGSAELAVSCASQAEIDDGAGNFVALDFGGVTAVTGNEGSELPMAVTAVRLAATDAAAVAQLSLLI